MALTFEITIGKGDAARSREITVDVEDLPLGFSEDFEAAQESGKWRDLIPVIADFLGLTREETRAITTRQFRQLTVAMQSAAAEQTAIPNG